MRVLVIRNPNAGPRRKKPFAVYLDALEQAGAKIDLHQTAGAGDAMRFASEAGPDVDAVIAAGGDGTINEVANGLMQHPAPPPLGVLPLGTANVYAAEVGLPFAPDALAACLMAGITRDLHLGKIEPLGGNPSGARHFVLMAGAGFDAQVVAKIDPAIKKRFGKGAYALETMGTFARADAACPALQVDGEEFTTSSAIAVNARYYAGRFVLSNNANPFSPTFDLCLFHSKGRLATLGYLIRVALGTIERAQTYAIRQVTSFDITGPAGAPIQADGDIIAHAPCKISMADKKIPAIVPA